MPCSICGTLLSAATLVAIDKSNGNAANAAAVRPTGFVLTVLRMVIIPKLFWGSKEY
jgi:hypothetical protein